MQRYTDLGGVVVERFMSVTVDKEKLRLLVSGSIVTLDQASAGNLQANPDELLTVVDLGSGSSMSRLHRRQDSQL